MAIQGDTGSGLPPQPHEDIWALPQIRALRIVRRRYRRPRKYMLRGRTIEIEEGVEIIIETDGGFPARALSPVLNVGRAQVAEASEISPHSYRFAVVEEEALEDGAPIRLGWIGLPPPEDAARFVFHAPRGPAEEEPELEAARWPSILDWLLRIIRRLFRGALRR